MGRARSRSFFAPAFLPACDEGTALILSKKPMSTDDARPMVELREITKRFGSFVAAHDVNLNIKAGEFLTLLGPSGCGKTTLLRMISGFETPTEGSVWLDGADVTHLPPYRRDVNQVFQSYALFPHLTVEENIAFGLKMKKTPKEQIGDRVKRGIDLVSLGGFEKRKPSELSGGQRQRVALARAIVCEPKVLLLDGKLPLVIDDAGIAPDAETLLLSIRPEKIHLQKTPITGEKRDNVFDATISEEIFKGATDDLTISTENGLELTVCAANESAHEENFGKGDKVYCRLHPNDIVVVQEE